MKCNKNDITLHGSYICEKCKDNPKVSTGFYTQCPNLITEGMKLYKRNAQGKPLVWEIEDSPTHIYIKHGLVGGNIHSEAISKTLVKANEYQSRINAKRKEGYKELTELKDSNTTVNFIQAGSDFDSDLYNFLDTYLPKYSTTSEGFVLPMLAKVLEDNKPFDKYGALIGQWKINGLRCLIGAEKNDGDMFKPIKLTYHSREGQDWTNKMCWMDDIILQKIKQPLIDLMIEESAMLDGELYIPGYSVNDINSFVKNPSLPQHYQLQYWWYDIAVENMSAIKRSGFILSNSSVLVKYFKSKEEHLNNKQQLIILPTQVVTNITNAIQIRDNYIDLGFEGLIVRKQQDEYQFGKRNSAMFKYKKVDDGLFEIVDIKPDKRGLPIYTLKNDINDELFECTINIAQDKQKEHFNIKHLLIGKKGLVEFRERSGIKQVPFHAKLIKIFV